MALNPIYIRWIRTGSKPHYIFFIYSIVLQTFFTNNKINTSFVSLGFLPFHANKIGLSLNFLFYIRGKLSIIRCDKHPVK